MRLVRVFAVIAIVLLTGCAQSNQNHSNPSPSATTASPTSSATPAAAARIRALTSGQRLFLRAVKRAWRANGLVLTASAAAVEEIAETVCQDRRAEVSQSDVIAAEDKTWNETGMSPARMVRVAERDLCRRYLPRWVPHPRSIPVRSPKPASPEASHSPASTPPPSGAHCTATAVYNSQYQDYDVYVYSNQPNRFVTATASNGESQSYDTDSSGYADVYLYADPGDSITVTVGAATCSTTA
jgi:hypothetical protein